MLIEDISEYEINVSLPLKKLGNRTFIPRSSRIILHGNILFPSDNLCALKISTIAIKY